MRQVSILEGGKIMLKPIREGKLAPLVCPECGCRLNFVTFDVDTSFAHHFTGEEVERDARGCSCPKIGVVWSVPTEKIQHLIA